MEAFWSDMVTGALSRSLVFMNDYKAVIILGLGLSVFASFLLMFKGDK